MTDDRDYLTGALTRGAFHRRWESILPSSVATPVGVAYLDMIGTGRCPSAAAAERRIADGARRLRATGAEVYRWGGDEFVAVFVPQRRLLDKGLEQRMIWVIGDLSRWWRCWWTTVVPSGSAVVQAAEQLAEQAWAAALLRRGRRIH